MACVEEYIKRVWPYIKDLVDDGLNLEEIMMHCASQSVTLSHFLVEPFRGDLSREEDCKRNDKWKEEMQCLTYFWHNYGLCVEVWEKEGLLIVE